MLCQFESNMQNQSKGKCDYWQITKIRQDKNKWNRHWLTFCTDCSQLKRDRVLMGFPSWYPWLKGVMISRDQFCSGILPPPGWKWPSEPAVLCHFTFFLCVCVWKDATYMWRKSIIIHPHFCNHTCGFRGNLHRVWKEVHSLHLGEGRKVMQLIGMSVAAMLAVISACLKKR